MAPVDPGRHDDSGGSIPDPSDSPPPADAMSSRPLYYDDAYRREFDAAVADSEGQAIFLDQTCFYPRGGGQPGDNGELEIDGAWRPVAPARRINGRIAHVVEGEIPAAGTRLRGRIDWDRRFRLMRLHTALHVLSQVVFSDYGAQVTGANIADDGAKARMDFALEGMRIAEILGDLEKATNALIGQGAAVKTYELPRAEAFQIPDLIRSHINLLPESIPRVRIVEIVGIDLQADGGTHVASTDQVGTVKMIGGANKGRINRRVEIALAD